jgi:hypothetical protein
MTPAEANELQRAPILVQCRDENVALAKKVCFDRMINCEEIDVSEVSWIYQETTLNLGMPSNK